MCENIFCHEFTRILLTNPCESVSLLKKQTFYRKDAKDAKIIKDEVQDFKSFSKQLVFPSCIINFLSALCVFAVRKEFLQYSHQ